MALINYKLLLLIDSFTPEELDQFRKFVSSPFYSKGRNYLPFLEKVLEYKKNNSSESEIEKELRLQISGKNLSHQTIRNRYSELYKLGEEFLINLWLSDNKIEKDKILLKKLYDKKLHTPFRISFREITLRNESNKFDIVKLKNTSELLEIYSSFLIERNKESQMFDAHFEYSKITFCSFLIQIFEIGFEFIQEEIDGIVYRPNHLTEFLKNIDIENIINDFRDSEILMFKITAMNYYLYKAYTDNDYENGYFIAHKIFSENFNELSDHYKIRIFTIMINYCIRKLNSGHGKYQYELFNLYKEKLSQNLVEDLRNKSYTFNHFKDFVFIGIAVEDYDWVVNFIEKYSVLLPPEIREDEIKISYAKLDFRMKNYERSLANLKQIKSSHYLQYIDTSLSKLFNYYELNEIEEAYLEIDKLKHYFRNNKTVPKVHFTLNMNFLKIYRKLLKMKTDPVKIDVGLIEKELKSLKLVSGKRYLLEKIAELKSDRS